jgi:hypothetical protein
VRRSLNSSASLAKVSDTSRTKELQVSPCLTLNVTRVAASDVRNVQVEVKETPTSWATKVNAIVAAGDDVDALRAIMGKHGRQKLDDGRYVCVAPSDLLGFHVRVALVLYFWCVFGDISWVPASEDCWIDTAQGNDRRGRNALLASVKNHRIRCATMLIDEFGADINYQVLVDCTCWLQCLVVHHCWGSPQTPTSAMYTGLIQAVYDNDVEMVRMLMARGADPTLTNKYAGLCACMRFPAVTVLRQCAGGVKTRLI